MGFKEEDFLQISGLQHFRFCRRQWALIHIEQHWAENSRTVEGAILHERAHDSSRRESRGDLLITRDMRVFSTPRGKFLARVTGIEQGNVLLRREQYRAADDVLRSCGIARNMIVGKLYNARWSIERTRRDHKLRIDEAAFQWASETLKGLLPQAAEEISLDALRGLEGVGAAAYFSVFDDMILRNKDSFYFHGRNRRPPLDNVNAMLSFAYSLLTNDCAGAGGLKWL